MATLNWAFYDPATATEYIPPQAPEAMTSPIAPRNLTTAASTSRRGQVITWEGAAQPNPWTFTGRILDQAHYQAMQAWHAKPNRIIITDHLARRWTVFITGYEVEPVRALDLQWSHKYTMSTIIFGRYA